LRIREFEWDEANENHIDRHAVWPEEAEQVCLEPRRILRGRKGRYAAFGQTEAGRYLMVIFIRKHKGIVRIITARDLDEREKRWTRL
jgi:uncharacterized protein